METIRSIEFGITGYKNFTKWSQALPPIPGTLQGVNYVITGGNGEIAFEAAKFAAHKGANVFLICRNEKRGTDAMERMKKQTGNQNVYLIVGQLGEKNRMNTIFNQLKEKAGRIDVLVHNAGCMIHERQFNGDKIESNFATNTFSVYYFTKLCLGILHQHSRVIFVSSGGMLTEKLQTDDIYMEKMQFDGTKQYAKNKRQHIALTEYFAENFSSKGKFVAMHPGFVDTENVKRSMPDFYKKMKDNLKPPAEGADTINYLSIIPFEELKSGQFYFDRQIADKHLPIAGTSYKKEQVQKLVNILEKI